MMAPFSMKKFFCVVVALLSVMALSSIQLVKGDKVSNYDAMGTRHLIFGVYIERTIESHI